MATTCSCTEICHLKFAEPGLGADTVTQIKTIPFQYPDGPHDAEALLVDSATKNIYVITKHQATAGIYEIPYPYNAASNVAVKVGTLPYTGVVSAAQAPGQKEIIIKTTTDFYYYTRNQSIEKALQGAPVQLPYHKEPQGEAVCFANNNTGFLTLSEKGAADSVVLYFYGRR